MRIKLFLVIIVFSIIILNMTYVSNKSFNMYSIKENLQLSEQQDHIFVRLVNTSWQINGPGTSVNNSQVTFRFLAQFYINGTEEVNVSGNICWWDILIRESPIELYSDKACILTVIPPVTLYPMTLYNLSLAEYYLIYLKEINQLPVGNYSFILKVGTNTSSEMWFHSGIKLMITTNSTLTFYDQSAFNWSTIPSSSAHNWPLPNWSTFPFSSSIQLSLSFISFVPALIILAIYITKKRKIKNN